MNRFGRGLLAAAPSFKQTCPRRALYSVEGAWRLGALSSGRISTESIQFRSFSASGSSSARHSPVLSSPRWINSKNEEDAATKESDAEETAESSEEEVKLDGPEDESPGSSANSESAPPASSSGDGNESDTPDSPASPPPESASSPPPPSAPGSIAKQSVPEIYPQVLALPIARRPLFPGFYKAVVVRNPEVVAAIKEMMKRGQPYLGAFLLKDENTDSDVITDINSVHPVGVFAQITSVFTATGRDDDKEEGLTAVLYPHRRIKITELVKAGGVAKVETVEEDEPQTVTPPPSPQQLPVDHVPSTGKSSWIVGRIALIPFS